MASTIHTSKRSMSAPEDETMAKPLFGPLVSGELFKSRWTAKINEVLTKHDSMPPSVAALANGFKDNFAWDIERCVDLFPIMLYCQREAVALGLTLSTTNRTPGWRQVRGKFMERLAELRNIVAANIAIFRRVKNGKPWAELVPWQSMPLSLRKKMNDLVWELDEADKRGEWKVNWNQLEELTADLLPRMEEIGIEAAFREFDESMA